jgi:hypothetical protein
MKKYFESIFVTIAVIAIVASYSLNLYLIRETAKQTSYKKEIIRLTEKRNSTISMALYTVYQDSINNAVQNWLEDGTSN